MATNIMDAIMLVGDSLTEFAWKKGGFAQTLAWEYTRKLDVINRGFAGYNTKWGLPVFKQCFPKIAENGSKIKLLTIWFGANDACLKGRHHHVPIEDFVTNLKEIIHLVRSPESEYYSPDTRIILITPPPVHEALWTAALALFNPPSDLDRKGDVTKLYAQAVILVGQQEGVPVINMFDLIWDAAGMEISGLEKYLYDGLHLSEAGYTVLHDDFVRTVALNYPELHYDNIPQVFPDWTKIDFKDPIPSIVPRQDQGAKL